MLIKVSFMERYISISNTTTYSNSSFFFFPTIAADLGDGSRLGNWMRINLKLGVSLEAKSRKQKDSESVLMKLAGDESGGGKREDYIG